MKIELIEIENFRSVKNESLNCSSFNTFVGPNGAGKSTVLSALNIFFGEIQNFSTDDFHNRNTSVPIKIRVTFSDLSDEAIDEFRHYVRGGKLVVQVEISEDEDGKFSRIVRGERLIFDPFKPFFEAGSAKERTEIFKKLREEFEDIETASNDADRRKALLAYEESLPDSEKTLTVSGEEFFGVSKGAHKLQRHICWVYVPAVKDASTESEEAKSSHLGKLIQHTIRSGMDYDSELEKIRNDALESYKKLLSDQKGHLSTLQDRLANRLQDTVTAETALALDWKKDEKSVSVQDPVAQVLLTDRGFEGEVDKFGHGLQRSFLLVILQELMISDSSVSPTLILGCEEPELYQHPPQAKHLAAILMELTDGDAQVFITTHSPYFIDVENYEGIKMFRNNSSQATISSSSFSSILQAYNKAFNKPVRNEDQVRTKLAFQTQAKFNEVFFADKVVLVEGISDLACFEAYLRLSGKKADFQKSGTSIIVCEGKSSLALMLLVAQNFKIPYHVIFDCDASSDPRYHDDHIRDNDNILSLVGHPKLNALPDDHIFYNNLTGWLNDIEHILDEEYGDNGEACHQAGRDAVGNLASSKKNPLYVAASMKAAWDKGARFPILERVVNTILS